MASEAFWEKARTVRLTPPQAALLAEIADTGLYIHAHGRYQRTVMALHRKGLVDCDEPDYSRLSQNHWIAVEP